MPRSLSETRVRILSAAQMEALRLVEKRDWPAGEPRIGWLNVTTAAVLLREGLIAERGEPERFSPNDMRKRSPIVDLTEAGRSALAAAEAVTG